MIVALGRAGVLGALIEVTIRALLNRRRTLMMLLLAAAPVLIALLVRLAGRPADPERLATTVLDALVLRTVLPLITLVFGTAALGSELEDGTATFLMTKPIARWRIVAAKLAGAALLSAALVVPAALVAGILIAGDQGGGFGLTIAFALAAALAIAVYAALFVALSVATGRALILGLVYVLLWEGVLAGLFEGTRILSVRQYAIAVWDALTTSPRVDAPLELVPALGFAVGAAALAFWLATTLLRRHQIRAPE